MHVDVCYHNGAIDDPVGQPLLVILWVCIRLEGSNTLQRWIHGAHENGEQICISAMEGLPQDVDGDEKCGQAFWDACDLPDLAY